MSHPVRLIILLWISCALGGTVTQTDWSSGPSGVLPQSGWGSGFNSCDQVSWLSIPGQLALSTDADTPSMRCIEGCGFRLFTIAVADYDGDGDPDVAGNAYFSGIVCWQNPGGLSENWPEEVIRGSGGLLTTADYDQDGDQDLSLVADSLACWGVNPAETGPWDWYSLGQESTDDYRVCSFDIDADGHPDQVFSRGWYSDGIVGWRQYNGTQPWTEHIAVKLPYPDFAVGIAAADLDGDGDGDIAVGADGQPCLIWLENLDGSGTQWATHEISGTDPDVYALNVADVDLDGDPDLLPAQGEDMVWIENRENGNAWTLHVVDSSFYDCTSSCAGDLDGDGDIDLAAVDGYQGSGHVCWWENPGDDSPWSEHEVCPVIYGQDIETFDIDGNGALDLVSAWWCQGMLCGGINWSSLRSFSLTGRLVSHTLDTGCAPDGAGIEWSSLEPPGTDLSIQYRSSNDPGNLGPWSESLQEPCDLTGLLDRYVQYKVLFTTADPAFSPILLDITLHWDPTGIEEPFPVESMTLQVSPSPASGQVRINIPDGIQGQVLVLDLTGRIVATLESVSAGSPLMWDCGSYPAGVYTVRLQSENWSSSTIFVVLH